MPEVQKHKRQLDFPCYIIAATAFFTTVNLHSTPYICSKMFLVDFCLKYHLSARD